MSHHGHHLLFASFSSFRTIKASYYRNPIAEYHVTAQVVEPVSDALSGQVLNRILQMLGVQIHPCTRHKEREDAQEYDTPQHMYLETYEHDGLLMLVYNPQWDSHPRHL